MWVAAAVMLIAVAAALLVVGVVRATTHRAVGTVPTPDGPHERCACGAERHCDHADAWRPRLGRHPYH